MALETFSSLLHSLQKTLGCQTSIKLILMLLQHFFYCPMSNSSVLQYPLPFSSLSTSQCTWKQSYQTYVYYNATINYFSEQHLPYAILAITVLILFTILPILLLCLYPRQCIQKFLNFCGQRCAVLHTFMDTFQDCYMYI